MGTPATDASARRGELPLRAVIVPSTILLLLVAGCGGSRVVPESGAALLRFTTDIPSPTPAPDELRLWAYDDGGRLWDAVRVPDKGALAMANAGSYGTLLVQPGTIHGPLRLHVRALAGGVRVMDGVASITGARLGKDTIDLRLSDVALTDGDGDDVPDVIDDCVTVANPAQGGCEGLVPPSDAAAPGDADAGSVDGAPHDAAGADASVNDSSSEDVSADAAADASSADAKPGADASGADASATKDGSADGCGDACGPPPRDKGIGQACTSAGQCVSGFCADGVCCVSACGAACQTCTTGVCLPVTEGKDVPECAGSMTCNKRGNCVGG